MYGDPETTTGSLPIYRSRVVPVPARLAPVLFERWWCETRRVSGWTQHEVIETEHGQLVMDPLTWNRSGGPSAMYPYRRVGGAVRVRAGRALPVELELAPWSASHSELGLRFTGRRVPRSAAVRRYHAFVEELLDGLGTELVDLRSLFDEEAQRRRRDAA